MGMTINPNGGGADVGAVGGGGGATAKRQQHNTITKLIAAITKVVAVDQMPPLALETPVKPPMQRQHRNRALVADAAAVKQLPKVLMQQPPQLPKAA